MRDLNNKEQYWYDKIIKDLNRYIGNKIVREAIISELDKLVEVLLDPHIDVDAVYEYFFGGSKK